MEPANTEWVREARNLVPHIVGKPGEAFWEYYFAFYGKLFNYAAGNTSPAKIETAVFDKDKFTARISEPVISEFQTLRFERRTVSGKKTFFTLPITRLNNADGTVTVQYPAIQPAQEDALIFIADDFWRTADPETGFSD